MREIKPDYYDKFACIAGRCPMTCCQEWKIAVDPVTEQKWKEKKDLFSAVCTKEEQRVIGLTEDHKCPFLNDEKLCSLVLTYGDELLSKTCRMFPREEHQYGDHVERSLMVCCPAVIDLLMEQEKIRFVETGEKNERCAQSREAVRNMIQLREKLLQIMQDKQSTPGKNLLMIFYLLLETAEKKELTAKNIQICFSSEYRKQLSHAIDDAEIKILDTFEERNELFLDLAVNYRREGLYQSYLKTIAERAQQISEHCEAEQMTERIARFEQYFLKYEHLMRNFLTEEIFADSYMPGGNLSDMMIRLQWLAMEYAVIRHAILLRWMELGEPEEIPYETVRDYMAVVARMTGYDEQDIYEYLENSFERIIWDWGYFALITGK